MVQTELLNDAAIALCRVLTEAGARHGAFGGWAIGSLGGPRESKDVDVLVELDKASVVRLLDRKHGFRFTGNASEGYAAFLWSPNDQQPAVLVELFTDASGLRNPIKVEVKGRSQGMGQAYLLDVVYLFKGKLRATATRDKFPDTADLHFLEKHYLNQLKANAASLNLLYVGLTLKRYPHLRSMFQNIGVDIAEAGRRTAGISLESHTSQYIGAVQKGLLG